MFICGNSLIGGSNACCLSPTGVSDITYVELSNGLYDTLYITKDTNLDADNQYPTDWDFDTILYAKFNGNTSAGNISWSAETVTSVLLKCRQTDSYQWKTLYVKDVSSATSTSDYNIDFNDYLANGETEYAVVPVYYGTEGDYSSAIVDAKYNKLFLIENGIVYCTEITDGFCDTERNIDTATQNLLNFKYPMFTRNSLANYDSGTCSGNFVTVDDIDNCTLQLDSKYDRKRIKYQKEVMDFITDGKPKILKLPDGRMWIIRVLGNPTDSAEDTYNNRYISFNWVEVADAKSEEDMYYLGFSDVSEEWW